MRILFPIFLALLFCPYILMGQGNFEDHFSDLDFISNPAWYGDTSKFIVNADSQLQLDNEQVTDVATLYTSVKVRDTATWEFFFKMDFNPSGSNALEIDLASNKPPTSADYSGYFLRIGESGGDDTWELLTTDGSNDEVMMRGTDGLFALNPESRIIVNAGNGNWEILVDTGNGQFFSDGVVNGYPLAEFGFFGISCYHTSTRSDRFYFDDFSISPLYKDTIAPDALSVEALSNSSVAVAYSEMVADSSATNENNYAISGAGNPQTIAVSKDPADPLRFLLDVDPALQNKQEYTLTITNIFDRDGNQLGSQDLVFTYFTPEKGDLVINEIFPDPNPVVGLPDAEFIELFNPTDFNIPLAGFSFADATDTVAFTDGEILPRSYVIICDKGDELDYQPFGSVLSISSLPALNNSGDDLKLLSPKGELLDRVQYTSDWYQDDDKSNGGWTLERIALNPLCEGKPNWRASVNSAGGTPGAENSLAGILLDSTAPRLTNVIILNDSTIRLKFNEPIASWPTSISFTQNIDSVVGMQILSNPTFLELKLSGLIEKGLFYEVFVKGVLDCFGNGQGMVDTGKFVDPLPAEAGDIVINEILFNPQSGGVDYVEIYNRSDKILPLNGFRILEWDAELNVLDDEEEYSGDATYIFPGDYITFTSDSLVVSNQYEVKNPGWLLEISGLPNFPDDNGIVVIYSSDSMRLDSLSYSSDWHYDLLADENGVSLERISFESETNSGETWFSASSAAGFGTPTYQNSQFYPDENIPGEITVKPEVFSPDQDGYKDLLSINLQMDDPGYTATIQIFDSRGRFIREVANNQLISSETTYRWDGIDNEGIKAQPGIYVVNIQMFHPNGRTLRENRKCVLAGRR